VHTAEEAAFPSPPTAYFQALKGVETFTVAYNRIQLLSPIIFVSFWFIFGSLVLQPSFMGKYIFQP
jgi:hypothetical protein